MEIVLTRWAAAGMGRRAIGLLYCALGVAAIALCAQVSVPTAPVPFTLQVFALAFLVLFGTRGQALATVGSYLALGAMGAPVFANGNAGIAALAGPTGGFLVGFLVAAATATALKGRLLRPSDVGGGTGDAGRGFVGYAAILAACSLVFMAVLYAFGAGWLCVLSGVDAATAFRLAVQPFVLFDLAKFAAAALCAALGYRVAARLSM